jgi:DNA (cytosine-5)-methyltransferase 1
LNELALFAGAGGGLLASRLLGWRTVCYVEWDEYAVEVLKARIRDGYLDDAPIWDDCFTFDGTPWAGCVDIITAGFPCQPFSTAGKGLAENDPRNGWPAVQRILGKVRPCFAFLENVPGIVSKPYIRRIYGDLAEIGYHAEQGIVSAASIGAPHLRERLWIVAYAKELEEQLRQTPREDNPHSSWIGFAGNASNAYSKYGEEQRFTLSTKEKFKTAGRCGWWATEPGVCGVAHGVAHRVDRLAAIGNGQVPEVARTAWNLLTERMKNA